MSQNKKEPILCYIAEDNWAYFTSQSLADQCGDDWNDAPYEHNAGPPYEPMKRYESFNHDKLQWYIGSDYIMGEDGLEPKWTITVIGFTTELVDPAYGLHNSHWSVDDINCGKCPWLRDYQYGNSRIKIMAGTTLSKFKELIKQAGGKIFVEEQ